MTWLIQSAVLLTTPPFFLGVIAKTKASFAGRKGPPLLQNYYDLIKLFRKGTVHSPASSFVLRLAPAVIVSTLLTAGLFFPLLGRAPIFFEGDVILFAYLLALGRFAMILAALDVGSGFQGMGASREAAFGAFSELAFFLGLVVLVVISGSASLTGIFQWKWIHPAWRPVFLLLFAAFFFILLAENSRMPVDDPSTHLELTMIHEGMILDYGGIDLGLILYGSAIKLFLLMAFAISLLWPQPLAWHWHSAALLGLKWTGMAVAIGAVESVTARLRLIKVPQLLIANFVVTLFALLVALFGRRV
ncbi:MAG: NADH-quinone oxidoreductase subunit H [Deltaproteobacteria bacterium]|nr:NADH-quinone oxidoreductase subunit H [Deltaproteobacteria bacterium]MBI4223919.1 NADH-quinone oxidoreductase subunit H [Deltaproteobacteria bacterium]